VNVPFTAFALVYLSVHLHGVAAFLGIPGLSDLGLWPIALALSCLLYVLSGHRLRLSYEVLCLVLFFSLALLSLCRGEYIGYGLAVCVSVLLNTLLFGFMHASDFDERQIRQFLLDANGIISALSIVLFFLLLDEAIAARGTAFRAGIGVVTDRGILPRLAGLHGDSNFFALLSAAGLMVGLFDSELRRRWLVFVIAGAITLSMSRSVIAGTAIAYVICRGVISGQLLRLGLLLVLVGAIVVVVVPGEALSLVIERRLHGIVGDESRFNLWLPIVTRFDLVWFGNGLYAIKAALGRFSHNTFIDVLVEIGPMGLALYVVFLGAIFVRAIARRRSTEAAWVFLCVLTLPFFSLLYNPVLFIAAGLIYGRSKKSPQAYPSLLPA
jgi:hypothetical protein